MKEKAQPDILHMCKAQRGIVYGAMLPDLPHPVKILRSTSHWEKWITQSISTIFYILFF